MKKDKNVLNKKVEPLVSILIPVFNGGNYLKNAIDSALSQSYQNLEIIVVNDGSSDNGKTEQIALSYGDRIRYLSKENGGCGTALNLGIRHMRGELFSWLSHDDIYLKDKISNQVDLYKNQVNSNSIIFSGFELIDHESKLIATVIPEQELSSIDLEKPLYPLLRGLIHGCSLLIPRKLFYKIGFFDENQRTTQDYALWFDLFRQCPLVLDYSINLQSRIHSHQDTQKLSELHLKECNALWTGFIKKLTHSERIALDGNEYNFLKKMSTHLDKTPYEAAKKFAKEEVENYISAIRLTAILVIKPQSSLGDFQASIESITNQTHSNTEIYIINLSALTIPEIQSIYNENGRRHTIHCFNELGYGIFQILAKVFEVCKGKYCSFLITPNRYSENKISNQIKRLENSQRYFCYSEVRESLNSEQVHPTILDGYSFPRTIDYNPIDISTVMAATSYLRTINWGSFSNHNWEFQFTLILTAVCEVEYCPLSITLENEGKKNLISNKFKPEAKYSQGIEVIGSEPFYNALMKLSYQLNFNEFPTSFTEYAKLLHLKINKGPRAVKSLFKLLPNYKIKYTYLDYMNEIKQELRRFIPGKIWIAFKNIKNNKL